MEKDKWIELKKDVLKGLNWRLIKSAHKSMGILWEYEDGSTKVPTIPELKAQVESLIDWCIKEDKVIAEADFWLVTVSRDPACINVWFTLEYSGAYYIGESERQLEDQLKESIEKEDYEKAAMIRDKIAKLKKEL